VKILLVEDHSQTRQTMVSLLTRGGHSVLTAETAAEAMKVPGQTRVHVLLADLGLPDGDGLDVVTVAKNLNPDIKAIALTARDSDDDYRVGFDAGFDHYLTKPIDFDELRRLLS
jgi:two-component system NtrC family sensor kinase